MQIKVLGMGCAKCNKLYALVERLVARTGIEAELEKVERLEEIMAFGALMTPALVIDGEVKSTGRIPREREIIDWISS